ncbi:hypothetical protein VDGL01_00078 [Verticillium dahliae]
MSGFGRVALATAFSSVHSLLPRRVRAFPGSGKWKSVARATGQAASSSDVGRASPSATAGPSHLPPVHLETEPCLPPTSNGQSMGHGQTSILGTLQRHAARDLPPPKKHAALRHHRFRATCRCRWDEITRRQSTDGQGSRALPPWTECDRPAATNDPKIPPRPTTLGGHQFFVRQTRGGLSRDFLSTPASPPRHWLISLRLGDRANARLPMSMKHTDTSCQSKSTRRDAWPATALPKPKGQAAVAGPDK